MTKIRNGWGREYDYRLVLSMMDDDIRDELNAERYFTEQEFYDEYCKRHLESYGSEYEFEKISPQI